MDEASAGSYSTSSLLSSSIEGSLPQQGMDVTSGSNPLNSGTFLEAVWDPLIAVIVAPLL